MKKVLIIIFLGLSSIAFGQVRVNVTPSLAVTFPVKPTKTVTDTNNVVYTSNLNGAYYIVTVEKLPKQADITFNFDSLDHFYGALVNSIIKKSNAKLVSKQTITIDDKRAIAFQYTVDNKSGFPDTRFQQSVYQSKVLVSYSFWTFKDKLTANQGNKDIFFNSIAKPTAVAPEVKYTVPVIAASADSGKTITATTSTTTDSNWLSNHLDTILGFIVGLLIVVGARVFMNKKKKDEQS